MAERWVAGQIARIADAVVEDTLVLLACAAFPNFSLSAQVKLTLAAHFGLGSVVVLTGCAVAVVVATRASLQAHAIVFLAATGTRTVYVLMGDCRQFHCQLL